MATGGHRVKVARAGAWSRSNDDMVAAVVVTVVICVTVVVGVVAVSAVIDTFLYHLYGRSPSARQFENFKLVQSSSIFF